MKVFLISVGTRGDMEPFINIGERLVERGCQVTCAFPSQFESLATRAGLPFFSLGDKYIALIESEDGKAAMGGSCSGFHQALAMIKLGLKQTGANKELVERQFELIEREQPDRILYNGKATCPILWEIGHKHQTIQISSLPYLHYVKNHSHVAFNSNFGTLLNRASFVLANSGMIMTLRITARWLKISDSISRRQIREALFARKVLYAISPSLFPRPDHWGAHLQVLGYPDRSKPSQWEPEEALSDFLARHECILFITFGSMTNPAPKEKTRMILDILSQQHIPAIINTASGGLLRPEGFQSNDIYFTTYLPYDWIFPRVYAVMHHGGSGTTHMGLKYGCPTLIIPHMLDQHVWNRINHQLGTGPLGIKIGKLHYRELGPLIQDLWENPAYKRKATQLADQMCREDFNEALYQFIMD